MCKKRQNCPFLRENKALIIDISLFLIIYTFLLSYFEPHYLLSKTTTTGGDTASHYYTAAYLKETLITRGKIIGWNQGNYAGYPLFLLYFPLPFLLMVFLSLFIPLQIAFKIATALGVFGLPICTYFSLKLLRYKFPIPIIAALFTLPFLFMEANSMWGGNIPSTLAGEFSFGLSFALSVLFVGSLYNGVVSERHVVKNSILMALIGFSHGYTLLFSGLASLFFLITTEDFLRKFKYIFKVHVFGFLIMGFWIIPVIFNLPYTIRYNPVWVINSLLEVIPVVLIPLVGVAILGRVAGIVSLLRNKGGIHSLSKEGLRGVLNRLDAKICYLWFCVIVSVVFYLIAYNINLVDIRFLPFLQIFLVIIAAAELGKAIQMLRVQWLFSVILAIMVFLWIDYNVKYIKSWIEWNYTGFEAKPLWTVFSSINNYLAGTTSDPRVVYEHSSLHSNIGTVRAFESIPLFSGRSTLEGIYMQSSISSPFVFLIQSEISRESSCPFPDYSCSTFNLESAIRHLKMFNVRDFIIRSEEVKSEIKKYPEFILKKSFEPYEIYELSTNQNRYITLLRYEPVLYETENWKGVSYGWFKNNNINNVHLVFTKRIEKGDLKRFKTVIKKEENLYTLPEIPVDISCDIEEEIKEDEILIKTNCINKPLLIKISYHPNWKVEGADRVYLVSPSFMLIFPDREHVRLRFSNTCVEYTGTFLTIIALFIVTLNLPLFRNNRIRKGFSQVADDSYGLLKGTLSRNYLCTNMYRYIDRNRLKILISTLLTLGLLLLVFVLSFKKEAPNVLNAKGMRYLEDNRYYDARVVFKKIITDHPGTSAANNASYYYAISYFKQANYPKTIREFRSLLKNYPKSNWVPEAYYHIGLCYACLGNTGKAKGTYQFVIDNYPASNWAVHSRDRLIELVQGGKERYQGPDYLHNEAMRYFDNGKYHEARRLFSKVRKGYPKTRLAEYSAYFYAICFFKEQRYREVVREFENFIKDYPKSAYVPEAYYHLGVSHQRLKDVLRAKRIFRKVIKDFPDSRWAVYSKEIYKTL